MMNFGLKFAVKDVAKRWKCARRAFAQDQLKIYKKQTLLPRQSANFGLEIFHSLDNVSDLFRFTIFVSVSSRDHSITCNMATKNLKLQNLILAYK